MTRDTGTDKRRKDEGRNCSYMTKDTGTKEHRDSGTVRKVRVIGTEKEQDRGKGRSRRPE